MSETEILSTPSATVAEAPVVDAAKRALDEFDQKLKDYSNDPAQMMNVQAVPITLFEDHVEVEIHTGVKKQISYPSFKDLINKSLNQVVENPVIAGMLPPSNMIFISQTENAMYLNCYYPGCNRDMLYGERKMNIVTPNIIIAFTLRKDGKDWLVTHANYFCTDLPVGKLQKSFINGVAPSQGIYDLPMSNTYGGGAMCYGGNTMPARIVDGNFRGLDWYFRYLWETPFNNDLGIRAIGEVVGVGTWYSILNKLATENKPFPYKDLRGWRQLDGSQPSESGITDRDRRR